ncbi:hypothetical protein GGH96_003191 [Coemansia sp. RSA 1972]|nr:hypothetical protein GGH96_003191 [Coemansia sp. RSA 1972]
MAKGASLSANPTEAHRRKLQKRETQRNKEVRTQMREAAVLHKDTTKMERRIEQLYEIKQTRKMTVAEREKLKTLEDELKDIRNKQQEAGITPKKRQHVEENVGYDPLAESEAADALVQYASSSGDSDNDIEPIEIGRTVQINRDIFDKTTAAGDSDGEAFDSGQLRLNVLPPFPPGTPPLFAADLGIGELWPPLPSGPSPLFIQDNPEAAPLSDRGRGRGRGQGRETMRGHHQQHFVLRRGDPQEESTGNVAMQHHRAHPYAPRASRGRGIMPHAPPVPAIAARKPAYSGTVLSAEPQVRDLRKELTAMVPSRIARKTKQKERQQVLDAVPTPPRMVVNAAPDIDDGVGSADTVTRSKPLSATFGTMAPGTSGVQLSTTLGSASRKHPDTALPAKKDTKQDATSLDKEYERFMENMNKFM